jgi:mRNA-degrading endonuclease toxin of MazEF toxin-antitoxin module
VVVQADAYNGRLRTAVVAQMTSNLSEKDDPACFLIETVGSEANPTGLQQDTLVCCYLLNVMTEDRLQEKIGELSPESLSQLNDCLKVVLDLT